MLEELLSRNKIGNKSDLLILLFELLSDSFQSIDGLRTYSAIKSITLRKSFDSLMDLLKMCSIVEIHHDKVKLSDINIFSNTPRDSYFETDHFYKKFFSAILKSNQSEGFINSNNIRFNRRNNQYYIDDSKMLFGFFSIRNLLISLEFFNRDNVLTTHLLIPKHFTGFIQDEVVPTLQNDSSKTKKSLEDLKKKIQYQEDAGKKAELFVLEFERKQLVDHPQNQKIKRISDEDVTAGYDIESYENEDSIFLDKFIEVKSFSGSEVSFYWSKNEIEVSRILGEKYYLYLIDRNNMYKENYSPRQFRDPYTLIYQNELWSKEAESWKVSLKLNV